MLIIVTITPSYPEQALLPTAGIQVPSFPGGLTVRQRIFRSVLSFQDTPASKYPSRETQVYSLRSLKHIKTFRIPLETTQIVFIFDSVLRTVRTGIQPSLSVFIFFHVSLTHAHTPTHPRAHTPTHLHLNLHTHMDTTSL